MTNNSKSKRLGYVHSDLQKHIRALKKTGCSPIVRETALGRSLLIDAINQLKKDDSIVVCSLEHLGKSLRDVIDVLACLLDRGVTIELLTPPRLLRPDSSDAELLALLALTTNFSAAKGRPPMPNAIREQILSSLRSGETPTNIAKRLGVARSTVYLYKRQL